MTLELEFSTDRQHPNTPEIRGLMGADQPLDSAPSSGTPAPNKVEVEIGDNYVKIRFHGVAKADASSTSIDTWSNSVTANLPGAAEVARRDV